MSFLDPWKPQLLSALRIMAALVYWEHGTQKLLGFPANADGGHGPAFLTLIWFAGVVELTSGALITVGLWTRIAAFVASGEMAFAYFIAHAPRGFFPALNGGDSAIVFCFLFLYLAAASAGPWSMDALLARKGAGLPTA